MVEIEKLADQLVALDVKQLLALKKVLKDKYGLEESTPVLAPQFIEATASKVEEKTEFDVILTKVSEVTAEKLNAVKEVNRLLNVGLKAAMDMVKEGPVKLAEKVSKTKAEEINATFTALNATIELK